MRAVITRVKSASVSIAGSVVGEIGHGLLILLGVGPDDTPELCEKLADKALGLRIFCDEAGKMNRSLADIGGQVLVVSQFTLYADCRKGKRPSFTGAALPEQAVPLQLTELLGQHLVGGPRDAPVQLVVAEGARVHQVPEDHRFIFSAHKAQGGLNGAGKAAAGDFHRGAPFRLGSIYPKSAFLRGRWIRI